MGLNALQHRVEFGSPWYGTEDKGSSVDPLISAGLYLAMGWLIVIAIRPLWLKVPLPGIFLLLAGGIAYTSGVAFYEAERVRYRHFVWHFLVVLGTTCQRFAVVWYAV